MKSFNFLHYGPGGNAYAERQTLSEEFPEAHFWDRPRVTNQNEPFKVQVRATADHLLHHHGAAVVAHSFGCDLLVAAMTSQPLQTGPLVLVSPIANLPQGLFNMGKVLQEKNPHAGLQAALAAAEVTLPHLSADKFWGLVSQIATHPDYGSIFWRSPERLAEYAKLTSEAPAFDAAEWQTVVQDFVFSNPVPAYENLKSKNTWVIIGDTDPYVDLETDVPFWRSIVGVERVIVIKNSGHFPHIESKQEFLDILKRI